MIYLAVASFLAAFVLGGAVVRWLTGWDEEDAWDAVLRCLLVVSYACFFNGCAVLLFGEVSIGV